jgi:hypothetical protein
VSDVERMNCIRYFNIINKQKQKEREEEKKIKEKHIPGTRSE